jgi:ribosomal protein S18 acetylase RimI-like enzyme
MPVTLRPATARDLPFARNIYLVTMRYITNRLPDWDEPRHIAKFAERFLLNEVRIIVRDGHDVGWMQVGESDDELFLKQIFLQPGSQRKGIGSQLIVNVIERGRQTGKPVRLGVVKINPAVELYKRHGFVITSEDEFKFYMEKRPVLS